MIEFARVTEAVSRVRRLLQRPTHVALAALTLVLLAPSGVEHVRAASSASGAAPVARSGVMTIEADTPAIGALAATDAEGDALTFSVVTQPTRGEVAIDSGTGEFNYTPNVGAHGYDAFTFEVSDSTGTSQATQMIFVTAAAPQWPWRTVQASVAHDGAAINGPSGGPRLSADGRYMTFMSAASNLVAGDTNGREDVFVRDLLTGTTTRANVATDGTQANSGTGGPVLTADGRYVAFVTVAGNLVAGGDANGRADIYVRDLAMGTTTRVSGTEDASELALSADGRHIAFTSREVTLVAGDTNAVADIFVRDRVTATTTRVSVATNGTQANKQSYGPSISADGRYVAFVSAASNLVVGDTNNAEDIFVRDLATGTTTRVNVGGYNNPPHEPILSADGRYIAFSSLASNLVAADTNGAFDVFVRHLATGTTTRVSVATGGGEANNESHTPSLSANGRYVAFYSHASNLVMGDTNGTGDIFVRDLATGTTTRVSVATGGEEANADSSNPSLSGDGRYVAFHSTAWTLVADDTDTNAYQDIFVVGAPPGSPFAQNGALSVTEDVSADGELLATDPDGDPLTFAIASDGANGTAVITNPATGAFTYTPHLNAAGADSFTFQTTDGTLASNVATVVVTIAAVNDAPVANIGALSVTEDVAVSDTLVATDPDGDPLTFAIVSNGAKGTAVVANPAIGAFTYTPHPNATGTDSFTFQASDGTLTSNVATVSVTIAAVNNAPVASNGTLIVPQNAADNGTLIATDPDSDVLRFVVVSNGAKGTAVIINPATGAYTYTPTTGAIGPDSFTFQATDGTLASNVATVNVTITPTVVSPGPPGGPTGFTATVSGTSVNMSWSAPASGTAPFTYTILARVAPGGSVVASLPVGAATSFGVGAPNGTFIVSVRATNALGVGPESAGVTVTVPQPVAPPGAPTGLAVNVVGNTATFSWIPASSGGAAAGYLLVAGLTPGFAAPLASFPLGPSTPGVAVGGVPPGTYYVRVHAQNAGSTSAASNEVAVSVAPPQPPTAPTLDAAVVTGNTVALSWTPGAGGTPTGYILSASLSPGGAPIVNAPIAATSVAFGGVPAGTYFVRLRAVNSLGPSAPSNEITLVVS